MSELYLMDCPIRYVDVGGGLGVDYDGSESTKSSINYDIQEYANDIVFSLQSLCDEREHSPPSYYFRIGAFFSGAKLFADF